MFYRPRRRPSHLKASIRSRGKDTVVDIVDVSEGGVKVCARGVFAVGDMVSLVTPRLDVPGRVQWADDGMLGVHFDRKLSPREQNEVAGMG